MLKRILSVAIMCLTVSVLLVGFFNITADAATSGYYTFTVSNGEATITDCDTAISGAVTIPSSLGGYPVTSIGSFAFYNCTSLSSITIPDSVTSIGNYAFSNCTSLTSIWVDANNPAYSSDSSGVLINKDKTSLIHVPRALIGAYKIPDSVTSIGNYAFRGCTSLTSITIPDSVTSIG